MADTLEDLEDLFDNAPCGYLAAGSDGRIVKVNQTFSTWLGRDKSELVGHRFQDFLNIAGKIYYETHFAPLMRMQGFFNEVALDLVRSDGSTLPVLVNAVERRDESGELRFIRITVFNASDRRHYERELLDARRAAEKANADLMELNRTLEQRIAQAVDARLRSEWALYQSQKMETVGQLTGGIAHDFNNMLAIILPSLNLLEKRLAKGEDVGRYIAAAREGAIRAADLTKRLLTFSRRQTLAPETINANQLVADMSELLRRTLGETVHFETVLAEGLWYIHADRSLLESAILNLSINARDAMPDGGDLTIETANTHLDRADVAGQGVMPGEYVMIAVRDTGTGMTPEVMAKAFEPFFTTKGVGKGTGLGLSQVFGYVKQSAGTIKVLSAVGRGTTMELYLPRAIQASGLPRSVAPARLAASGAGELILLVEDDQGVLSSTGRALRELGYEVIEAQSGREALTALRTQSKVCLLFTDVVMPEMSGLRLAEQALQIRPDLKVLFTTGYASGDEDSPLLDAATNLLQKPASLEELEAKIRDMMDKKS